MVDIFSYIEKIESEYGIPIKYNKVTRNEDELLKVPVLLRKLYEYIDGITFPFGTVYSLDEAVEKSREPIFDNFFCFGHDYTKEHGWLCLYEPNEFGASFNFSPFDEPVKVTGLYKDVIEFFEDMRSDYDDDPWNEKIV